MSLVRIAPLIRFLPKAHPFGSPIYVTASQHVPFASTAFGIQRAEFPRPASEARIQDATKQVEPAKNPPASLLQRDRRASIEALWETAKAETTLRSAQDAGKRLSASRSPRKGRRGNNVLATSASYCPFISQLPSTLHWTRLLPTLAHCFPRSFSFCGDRGVIRWKNVCAIIRPPHRDFRAGR